ncbi:MAG: alpha/beta hydrolase-fold protein [Polyangiaceae bacterium]
MAICAACGSANGVSESTGGTTGVGSGGSSSAAAGSGSTALGAGTAGAVLLGGGAGAGTAGAGTAGDGAGGLSAAAGGAGVSAAGAPGGGSSGSGSLSAGAGGAESSVGDGDFVVGPTYTKSGDLANKGAQAGKSFHFSLSSVNSQIFKGDDATLASANQHTFMRGVDVYVPAKYKDGDAAPFMVIQDGPGQLNSIKLALDNLTQSTDASRRLPAFIAIAVANGGGDSIGSERGLEYDTMSDRYARFIQTEVLPAVLANPTIKVAYPSLALTTDPDGRATIGCSSGAAAAFTMGWFHPEWFHRIVAYSGTFVAQQNPAAAEHATFPEGAWDYHSDLKLIQAAPAKPLRIFINANEQDNGYDAPESGRHNWLLANQRTAAALKAQGYHYRFVEGLGAGHCQGSVQDLTLPETLLWVWRGYSLN